MPTRRALLVTGLLAVIVLPARAEDFWNRMLPDQPSNFIFGYGSLVNTASRNATSSRPIPPSPRRLGGVRLIRVWNIARRPASRHSVCASPHQARAP